MEICPDNEEIFGSEDKKTIKTTSLSNDLAQKESLSIHEELIATEYEARTHRGRKTIHFSKSKDRVVDTISTYDNLPMVDSWECKTDLKTWFTHNLAIEVLPALPERFMPDNIKSKLDDGLVKFQPGTDDHIAVIGLVEKVNGGKISGKTSRHLVDEGVSYIMSYAVSMYKEIAKVKTPNDIVAHFIFKGKALSEFMKSSWKLFPFCVTLTKEDGRG